MFKLYKKDKLILHSKYGEDLEYFVEELKRLNPSEVNRKDFKIISSNGVDIYKTWSRK